MNNKIKYILISLLTLVFLISCDTDASSGILSNIVNSEEETEYEMNAITAKDNDNLYSLESDGIYLSTDNDSDDDDTNSRELILDTSNYLNIENLYYADSKIYFICLDKDDYTEKVLYYFNPDDASPTPTEISFEEDGELLTLYSNGYVSAIIDDYYYYQKLSDTAAITDSTATNTNIPDSSSLAISIPMGEDMIIQTVDYDDSEDEATYDYYFLDDTDNSTTNFKSDQDSKIVAAVTDGTNYYAVLSDADLIYINNPKTEDTTVTTYYDASDDSYEFDNLTPYMYFEDEDFLLLADDSNYVMLYDLTDTDTDSGLTVLSEGFANIITNTSDIVYYKEVSNSINEYVFYLGTNTNGYYTMIIEDATILEDDDSDNSNYTNEINADLTMDD
ncbi:MAG: hypothetical protein ACPKM0_05070 [Pleomorphochaeta sp.]